MSRPVKTGMSLLVGTGIGLGMMYLLDPKVGAERRRHLNKNARAGLSKAQGYASDAVGAGWDHIQDVAGKVPSSAAGLSSLLSPAVSAVKDAYDKLGEHLHSHIDDVQDKTTDAVSDATAASKAASTKAMSATQQKLTALRDELVGKLSSKAGELSEPLKAKYSKLLKETTLAMGRDEDHHYVGQTACALSSLALGGMLVYFFDSDKGHDRRDKVAESLQTGVTEIGQFFRKIGTRLVHQSQDIAQSTSEHFGDVTQKAAEIRDNYFGSERPSENTAENFVQ